MSSFSDSNEIEEEVASSSASTTEVSVAVTSSILTTSTNPQEEEQGGIINNLAIFWHPSCSLHLIPDHPEQPGRVDSILNELRKYYPNSIFREAPLVTDEQILSFHTTKTLTRFKDLCDKAEADEAHPVESRRLKMVDGDTVIMAKTREAAYRAAGSTIAAIDALYLPNNSAGKIKTAFCAVRPPGHHAERNKMCGFCFLNNAGIAAKYAQNTYGVQKVAVLDFDVHHGNGTEEGFTEDDTLFYGSTHEKDNFPGTGKDPSPYIGERVKKPEHRRIVNRYLNRGPISRSQFRVKWKDIIEEMILFAPDLIIFSAGFDAHDEDPLASCELIEEDFQWATKIVLVASRRINAVNPPPCISVLEGGYDLDALATSAAVHVEELVKGPPPPRAPGDEVGALIDHLESLDIY